MQRHLRRLARWLFNLAVAVSLAMSLAVAALLVRSYWRSDDLSIRLPDGVHSYIISTGEGGSMVQIFGRSSSEEADALLFDEVQWQSGPAQAVGGGDHLPEFWRRRGFTFNRVGPMESPGWLTHRVYAMPLWFPALVLAILPLAWLARWRRDTRARRRRSTGLCARCRYDLRASGDRCPECGDTIPATTTRYSVEAA